MRYGNLREILILLLLTCCITSCYPIRHDGPYKGRIIDAETGKPIEGVVVLGVWYKEIATVAGGVSSYYDAKETVTDKNGEFEIKGMGLKILSNIGPMHVLIFKAGYEYIGSGLWESLKLDGGLLKEKVIWEGDRAIIPLRILTQEERQKSETFPSMPATEAPLYKVSLMLKEINKEAIERGLEPIDIWHGEKVCQN